MFRVVFYTHNIGDEDIVFTPTTYTFPDTTRRASGTVDSLAGVV